MPNPFTQLMAAARAHALAHGAPLPSLSPEDAFVLNSQVNIAALHALGIKVVPWTTNDPALMHTLLEMGVDGLISDRPDLLQLAVSAARSRGVAIPADFDLQGHRGARGLRPENTLPAFEAGLDCLVTTLETDTGVTRDHHSVLWHDQFLNPVSCRRLDGTPYSRKSAIYIRDISLAELQATFVCDQLHPRFPEQSHDPALSPVAVAFAAEERLPSAYAPLATDQLFRFTAFYAQFYASGAGRAHPDAARRAANAARVRFNLETKILPFPDGGDAKPTADAEPVTNHTVDPQTFVHVLCGTILRGGMETRAFVQSFDFRTLQLIEEQYPRIATYYLTEDPRLLTSDLLPQTLRLKQES